VQVSSLKKEIERYC